MISRSENSDFTCLTNENNSFSAIAKWTFFVFRVWGENVKTQIEKIRMETGVNRNNIIFGYFKIC